MSSSLLQLVHVGADQTVHDDAHRSRPSPVTEARPDDRHNNLKSERTAAGGRPRDLADLEGLVRAASAGDEGAWSLLVEKFAIRLSAVARAYRLGAHDVEDVVQTTWLRLLEHIDKLREPRAVVAWLDTTVRRESLRALRARQREYPTDSSRLVETPVAPVDEQRLVTAERRAAVASALGQLTGRQQRLLWMLFANSAPSYKTISDSVGLPIGSIGPTRARALANLRRIQQLETAVGETPA